MSDITQGLWFYEYNGQPVEDTYGIDIETEHVAKFLGHKIEEDHPSPQKGHRQGVCLYTRSEQIVSLITVQNYAYLKGNQTNISGLVSFNWYILVIIFLRYIYLNI